MKYMVLYLLNQFTSVFRAGEEYEVELFEVPPHAIPIRCDVRYLDWDVRQFVVAIGFTSPKYIINPFSSPLRPLELQYSSMSLRWTPHGNSPLLPLLEVYVRIVYFNYHQNIPFQFI